MGNILKDIAGVISPAYGALTGEGMFGNLLGKQSEQDEARKVAANKAAADEAAAKKAQLQAQSQAWANGARGMKKGGKVSASSKSSVSSASKRADGIATKGKTRGRMV